VVDNGVGGRGGKLLWRNGGAAAAVVVVGVDDDDDDLVVLFLENGRMAVFLVADDGSAGEKDDVADASSGSS
jgi:hypothetical protein